MPRYSEICTNARQNTVSADILYSGLSAINQVGAVSDKGTESTEFTLDGKNKKLIYLNCSENTKIQSLTVGGADELTRLLCYNSTLTSLDVSKNGKLTFLQCNQNPNLSVLNLTNLLQSLECFKTAIASLDVSNYTSLTYLDCGANDNLSALNIKGATALETLYTLETNITEAFKGIDINKIEMISGGSLDKGTGIVSGYKADTPIVYNYACGTSQNIAKTLQVTLNLTVVKADSTISITENLNKTYNGTAVNDSPTVTTTGSTGAVTYVWEKKKKCQ